MKKALTLFGILCLLLAFAIPIFVGPMSIVATPFWDSTPYSVTNPITGGDPGENPVRIGHWQPLESFVVDGTYDFTRMEIYVQMCNYLPDDLASLPSFPEAEINAILYNKTPQEIYGETPLLILEYEVDSEIINPRYISLESPTGIGVEISPDPSRTYSLRFSFFGAGADYYDMCMFRSQKDAMDGRGYIYSDDWNSMPPGEGQDFAMKLYGTKVTTTTNGNGDPLEPDCDGDGIPDATDTDDNNDCKGGPTTIISKKQTVPLLTAFLFALGGILLLLGIGVLPLGGWGWLGLLIVFVILFAIWYFWLVWAWLGVFAPTPCLGGYC